MKVLAVLAAACCALAFSVAEARPLRQPATGSPALVLEVPDSWGARYDSSGNLILAEPNHTAAMSITVGADAETELDNYVSQVMSVANGSPPQRIGVANIDGAPGSHYRSSMVNGNGVALQVDIAAARIDPSHVATMAAMADRSSASSDVLRTMDGIIQSARIDRGQK